MKCSSPCCRAYNPECETDYRLFLVFKLINVWRLGEKNNVNSKKETSSDFMLTVLLSVSHLQFGQENILLWV